MHCLPPPSPGTPDADDLKSCVCFRFCESPQDVLPRAADQAAMRGSSMSSKDAGAMPGQG